MFCVKCGKEYKEGCVFCAYCGAKLDILNKENVLDNKSETKSGWPIAIFKESNIKCDKFFAYDIATESETDTYYSMQEVLLSITKDIEKWKFSIDEIPTEQMVKNDSHVKDLIADEFELVKIEYLDIYLD